MKSVVLCILDGWGCSNSILSDNAIIHSDTPFWDYAITNFPNSMLSTSGTIVGLPPNQMGSSEVGHATIGSGRTIFQDLLKINNEIHNISYSSRFLLFTQKIKKQTCHIIGLLSDGGVHSHENHIIEVSKTLEKMNIHVHLHCILDGRDTPPKSAIQYIKSILHAISYSENISISTICGRYYAMDRDKRADRTLAAYSCIINANAPKYKDPLLAIEDYYNKNITDEFIPPTIIGNYSGFNHDESIFLANFRADRMIQLSSLLLKLECNIASMTKYSESINIPEIFPQKQIYNTIGEIIESNDLKQLRIAETEKYAHVTYFFNAKKESSFHKEERILIPSPLISTYDLSPQMSAIEITNKALPLILKGEHAFIVINYANADMVGHTGNLEATKIAISTIDKCLRKISQATSRNKDCTLIITADHGNAETMFDYKKSCPHTAHTTNPVPFVVFDKNITLEDGSLRDISPTILDIFNLSCPKEMNGNSLIKNKNVMLSF